MAIANIGKNSSAEGSSSPVAWSHILGAGADRIVVLSVIIENTGDPGTVTATYDSVSMNQIGYANRDVDPSYRRAYLFYLDEADLDTSGTKNVSVSISGTPSSMTLAWCCLEFENVMQGGPLDYDPDGLNGTEITLNPSMVATDLSVIGVMGGNDAYTFSWSDSQTEAFDYDAGGARNAAAYLVATGSISALTITASASENFAAIGAWWHEVDYSTEENLIGLFFGKGLL